MPMRGRDPIRRTIQYLKQGKLHLRENVQIFTINYNQKGAASKGARDFIYWNLGQLQYKSPHVQILTFKNLTPTPLIQSWLVTGEEVVMDIDSKDNNQILEAIQKVLGKSAETLAAEERVRAKSDNPANFGEGCLRKCICEVPGQIPCPGVIPLPKEMRGKYKKMAEQ
ncbi:small ribosomal subunit protein mS25-like [Saccoglossus kowalevskii]|uniref:Small ribosomal subunit protein mS25 n=1 Tax=Saccoglossus kowalevskii TaxID=10224 RepID=A0ABM0GTQ1_SACKO|nr:PREDICTED: probable 28S ribosomal protein S25, mitochondrial-like [Saccoglossus kowalevskii]